MKKITLGILLLLSMLSFGQSVSVTVTQLKVLNVAATTVNFAKNVTSVNVSITVSAHTSYTNTAKGSIAVYYKRNSSSSTTPIIPTNGYDGNFFLTNGSNGGTGTKTFTITLSRSEFDETGGIVYLEYRPDVSNLLAYKSSNINVTKFDVTVPTTPTAPVTNNTISGSQTIAEGQSPTTLVGSIPSGGNGTFTYAWQAKTENGTWMLVGSISSSNPNYAPGVSSVTKTYRRIAQSGTESTISNEIIVTVIPAPILQNNTIAIDGTSVNGSSPTGGISNYTYSWVVINGDGDSSTLSYTSPNVMLSAPEIAGYSKWTKISTLARVVHLGSQSSVSNFVVIPYIAGKQSSTISINNNQIPDETSSTSNELSLDDTTITGLSKVTSVIATVYPNPTSGSVNFTTSFSSNKGIEIIVYSEELGKTQSVFKGIVTPNQIITWEIPSNHPKGIYFYKIVSGNEEIKSGKIIFQ